MSADYKADKSGWGWIALGTMPGSSRDVLVWNCIEGQPHSAFFDSEEGQWISKWDGEQLADGAVTHWCEIQMPEGVSA